VIAPFDLTHKERDLMTPRKQTQAACRLLATLAGTAFAVGTALAQSSAIPPSLVTPDKVETRIGTLDFKDGAPSRETLDKVYDNLDFIHATSAFLNTLSGVSIHSARKGLLSVGVKDNEVIVFSQLMDAKSLFLTANADTVYAIGVLDLTKGPMVLEVPPKFLGTIDDYWFRWVIDLGLPGSDRGEGGKYLVLPPAYDGPLPDGGFAIARARTARVLWFGRMFHEDNDPKPAADAIRKYTRIYPYQAGGVGTPIAEFLAGKAKLGPVTPPPPTVFHDGSGKVMNTLRPKDFSYFESLNEVVQQEPATSLDPELMGPIAAIGIVKGKKFAPDERMKKILTDAAVVGQAAGRVLNWRPFEAHPDWAYYPNSMWGNMLWEGGAFFETPPPAFKDGAFKPLPPTGARTLDSRTAFYYGYTLDSPGMIMNIPGVGSQYLMGFLDANGDVFDGSKAYKVTLPKGIPAKAFWSFTLYDNQTRSMLQTPQKYPRAGSQSYPSPAAKTAEGGTTTIWFSPEQPGGVDRGNWIQTDPKKGWFTILRLYSPLPSFFDKSWRPSEIELVR